MGKLRAAWRLLVFALLTSVLLVGYWLKSVVKPHSMRRALKWRRQWLNTVPRFMGLQITCTGAHTSTDPVIYLSNHRSYLDPILISRYVAGVVIAKSEVLGWPLIGAGTKASGVLYVKREDKSSRANVLKAMENVLSSGLSILNFPEGTTSKFPGMLPLRPRTFELAAARGVPVVPIVIEFADPEDAWVGDDTFLRHFFQSFSKPVIVSYVIIGQPITGDVATQLRTQTESWMHDTLASLQGKVSTITKSP